MESQRNFLQNWLFETDELVYALVGVILDTLIAMIVTLLTRLRIAPTTLGKSAIRVGVIGLALGLFLYSVVKTPALADEPMFSATACTADNIETAFQAMKAIDNAIGNNAALKSLAKKADHLWSITPDCSGSHPDFTDENRGKYIDVLLLGSADSVLVYYDASRFADAKKCLGIYFVMSDVGRKTAQAKGWTQMLSYINTVDPLMNKYAKQLGVSHP